MTRNLHTLVYKGAELAEDVDIGHFCLIEPDVFVGSGTVIKNYVELRSGTRIGRDCFIDSYVVSSGDCQLGDRVTLRYGVIVARGTYIEDDAYVCPRTMFNNLNHKREAIGGAHVEAGVFIGTHAVIAAGIRIHSGVVVGAQAFVSKSLTEPGTYVGVPARKVGL